jgi:hypothetical protein
MATQEFYYKISDLQSTASYETVQALDGVEADNGGTLVDRHIFGENEDVFFKRLVKIAASVVFKRLHRRGRGILNSYQFDVEKNTDPGYIIFTFSFPDNFDVNLFDSIDTHIREALINHTLSGWFSGTRRNYKSEDYKKLYTLSIDQAKSIIEMRTGIKRRSDFWGKHYLPAE